MIMGLASAAAIALPWHGKGLRHPEWRTHRAKRNKTDSGKYTGDPEEIEICKKTLEIS